MSLEQTLERVAQANERLIDARYAERQARNELADWIRRARHEGHSLAEIGKVLGLSRQRVEQLSR